MSEAKEDIKPKSPLGYKVWFTSDTHFSHKSILKYTDRHNVNGFDSEDMDSHDKWLIDKWNKTVSKKDHVYIIGDFSFRSAEENKKLLGKLNGIKYLIEGNHDNSSKNLKGYFKTIKQFNTVTFKKNNFDFLKEDFHIYMSHCPHLSWPDMQFGVCHIHGHSHGRYDDYNDKHSALRVDVGIDGRLANYGLISLEDLYKHFKKKSRHLLFSEYMKKDKNEVDNRYQKPGLWKKVKKLIRNIFK